MPLLYTLSNQMNNIVDAVEPLLQQTKTTLRIYREVKWTVAERQKEMSGQLESTGWDDIDTGVTYLLVFAPDTDLREFEARICHMLKDKHIFLFISNCIQRLKRYPEHGHIYHEIIDLQYLANQRQGEPFMLDWLKLERSTFYRRKREALLLLGLCLFGLTHAGMKPQIEQLSIHTGR